MMVLTDPRLVIRRLFDPGAYCKVTNSNLLEEDGVHEAKYEADYEYSELMLERLMLDLPVCLDLIFVISLVGDLPPDMGSSGPVNYNHVVGVQPVTIHKYNADGTVKVNGIKLGYAAGEEVKRVIRENPFGSLRNIRGRREDVQRVGSSLIFGDVFEVLYKQYASAY